MCMYRTPIFKKIKSSHIPNIITGTIFITVELHVIRFDNMYKDFNQPYGTGLE